MVVGVDSIGDIEGVGVGLVGSITVGVAEGVGIIEGVGGALGVGMGVAVGVGVDSSRPSEKIVPQSEVPP